MTKPPVLILHPFIFAALPVILSLSIARYHVLPEEAFVPLLVVEFAVAIFFALSALILKDAIKAALVSSLAVIFCFCFQMFQLVFGAITVHIFGRQPEAWLCLGVFAVLVLALLCLAVREKWTIGHRSVNIDHLQFCSALNMVSLIILLLNGVPLWLFEIHDAELQRKALSNFQQIIKTVKLNSSAPKPDVYYIILDQHPNSLTLKYLLGYDERDFTDFLQSKGFFVVPESFSNYDCTILSMSSALNMQYLNTLPALLGTSAVSASVFNRLIQDSSVLLLFKHLGYKCINICSGYVGFDPLNAADKNLRLPFRGYFADLFPSYLILLTPWSAMEKYIPWLRDLWADIRLWPGQCLPEIVAMPGPKVVTIHSLLTHWPALFDEYGHRQPLPLALYNEHGTPESYVGQLKFAHIQVEQWLTTILNQPGPQPVIIIQSDHGPHYPMPDKRSLLNEQLRNFSAIYFPGMHNKGLYDRISSVNVFRTFFNDYFDAKMQILPDRSYALKDPAKFCSWEDITPELYFNSR